MTCPDAYYDAVTVPVAGGSATLVEPWYAPPELEPLGRAILVFVQHAAFSRRAAARSGEHFNTRVAYLESPPPPEVRVADARWDERFTTRAASPLEADVAFPKGARQLLLDWNFTGHVEVRPGGLVLHPAATAPVPEHLARLVSALPTLVGAFVGAKSR
jgi:hypothetical protein